TRPRRRSAPTPRPPPPTRWPRRRPGPRERRACCGRPGSIGAQAVSRAAHRVDQAAAAGRLERLAQAAYVHVHRALPEEDVIAPHLVEELCARVDATGVGHEEMQQPEL